MSDHSLYVRTGILVIQPDHGMIVCIYSEHLIGKSLANLRNAVKIQDDMLKIFQARLQLYMNRELSDVQAGFRKGRGSRDQIANIHWIMEKAREFQKNICCCCC